MLKNKLLLAIIGGTVAYWGIGLLVPGGVLSSVVGGALLVFGVFAFMRYGRDAYEVVVNGLRSENGDGSHLAVLGMALIAFGSVYVGGFSVLWNVFDQPQSWLGTVQSSFGRYVMTAGFALMYFSPDVGRPQPNTPPYIWFAIILVCVALVAGLIGLRIGNAVDTPTAFRTSYLMCAPDRPIWGNERSGIYHLPSSPYRAIVQADRCFKTVAEARRAGFRPPHRS